MITFFTSIIFIIGLTIYAKYFYKGRDSSFLYFWICLLFIITLIATFGATGNFYSKAANVNNSQYVVEEKLNQRDQLALVFEDVLDNNDYIQLIESAHPEDISFLKTNPEVTGFLLGRADRIVAINQELYSVRNELLNEAKEVCNFIDNPFIPKLPFATPECKLGQLETLFSNN